MFDATISVTVRVAVSRVDVSDVAFLTRLFFTRCKIRNDFLNITLTLTLTPTRK